MSKNKLSKIVQSAMRLLPKRSPTGTVHIDGRAVTFDNKPIGLYYPEFASDYIVYVPRFKRIRPTKVMKSFKSDSLQEIVEGLRELQELATQQIEGTIVFNGIPYLSKPDFETNVPYLRRTVRFTEEVLEYLESGSG